MKLSTSFALLALVVLALASTTSGKTCGMSIYAHGDHVGMPCGNDGHIRTFDSSDWSCGIPYNSPYIKYGSWHHVECAGKDSCQVELEIYTGPEADGDNCNYYTGHKLCDGINVDSSGCSKKMFEGKCGSNYIFYSNNNTICHAGMNADGTVGNWGLCEICDENTNNRFLRGG